MKKIWNMVRPAIIFSLIMVVICGLLYPLAVTGVSQLVFPDKANGSMLEVDGKAVASSLVGQEFSDPRLFHGRPSSVNYNTYEEADKASGDYAGVASGSNNYANTNPDLESRMNEDINQFLAAHPGVQREDIPVDLVTQSGSGLDPEISLEGAKIQIPAIAKASGLSEAELLEIVEACTNEKVLGVLGEVTVNIVECNLEIAQRIDLTK